MVLVDLLAHQQLQLVLFGESPELLEELFLLQKMEHVLC